MTDAPPSAVLLLTSDLATSSKVAGAAMRQSVRLEVAMDASALAGKAAEARPRLVILDLSTPRLDIAAAVRGLTFDAPVRPTIVAFGPHVHEALLAAASAAGCDRVLSRGQFHAHVDELLSGASHSAAE
jgi:AmiR/NasT family two-component response regulator